MYFNDVHILYYVAIAILGLFAGELVRWMNIRLPKYKKIFSKDYIKQKKFKFKPNYILMLITSAIFVTLLYKRNTYCKFRFNKIHNINSNVIISFHNRL